jgi:hypothetical protein
MIFKSSSDSVGGQILPPSTDKKHVPELCSRTTRICRYSMESGYGSGDGPVHIASAGYRDLGRAQALDRDGMSSGSERAYHVQRTNIDGSMSMYSARTSEIARSLESTSGSSASLGSVVDGHLETTSTRSEYPYAYSRCISGSKW